MQDSNLTLGILNISCGVLFILLSIPLVSKKVPMNGFYGFRISKAFESEKNWYKVKMHFSVDKYYSRSPYRYYTCNLGPFGKVFSK